jgi:hypothetical protein
LSRSRIKRKLQNAMSYYNVNGCLQFLKLVQSKIGLDWPKEKRLVFCRERIDMQPDHDEGLHEVRLATAEDIAGEENFENRFLTREKAIERIQNEHFLFILKRDGKIASSRWVERENAKIPWFDNLPLKLPADVVYGSHAYTSEKYRNQSLNTKIKKAIYSFLKERSVKYYISVVSPGNAPMLRIQEKTNAEKYQIVYYIRYLFVRRFRVQKFGSEETKSFVCLFKPKELWKVFWKEKNYGRAAVILL